MYNTSAQLAARLAAHLRAAESGKGGADMIKSPLVVQPYLRNPALRQVIWRGLAGLG